MRTASRALLLIAVSGRAPSGNPTDRARALQRVEQRECAGVADGDRDLGPFAHRELLDRVEPILERAFAKAPLTMPVGAIVYLRASPGMTEQWLQRIVDCHLAHHALAGAVYAGHAACPLVAVDPPQVFLRSTNDGFTVHIRSSRLDADEVLARSLDLIGR